MNKLTQVTEIEWEQVCDYNKQITSEFLEQQHLSPQTLRQYQSALKLFFRWVKDNCNNKPLIELKPRDALRYQNFLMGRDLSSSGVKFKRSAVSSLCGYIELYYAEEYPIFRNIYNKKIPNPPKAAKYEKKPLTKEELKLLIETLEGREEWQMLTYVQLSYSTGGRRAEVGQLLKEISTYEKVKDKKTGEYKNYYMTNKVRAKGGGRVGVIKKLTLSQVAMDSLLKWLDVRGEDECQAVFVKKTKNGQVRPLHPSSFNYWCNEVFTDIVGRRVHPHQLRSTRATHLVVYDGKDIKSAQSLLGHQSSETTEIYVVRDSDDDVDDAF